MMMMKKSSLATTIFVLLFVGMFLFLQASSQVIPGDFSENLVDSSTVSRNMVKVPKVSIDPVTRALPRANTVDPRS
ncbi:hypothetical protein BVRB_5g105740 [Beta vulgaris subsp. vulgaris]|uniref:Uncharacterized protein n=1 Tax=Beta vulgaris subsp. vulgaris TaxID=3555 RepID=A0A0J8CD68_BETVV|nr:hypothetical protein BVRB_5g105740 [Beta vulgaris subsp. vulgaris]